MLYTFSLQAREQSGDERYQIWRDKEDVQHKWSPKELKAYYTEAVLYEDSHQGGTRLITHTLPFFS